MKLDTILVPVDFSAHARAAFDYALDLAARFKAEIHLLHAYQSLTSTASLYGAGLPIDFDDQVREAASKRLSEWQARGEGKQVAVETHVSALDPARAIENLRGQLGADLIVMGTHGRTGLAHVMLGSTAERTIRTAACPVLTVKWDD